jgi:Mn-dependent transcriptional regulator
MAQGHSIDEYLETIYFLAFPIGEYTPRGAGTPPLASRVAEMLHVSRASAGEMLKRLEAEGLIERGARKEALLTKTGRERAEHVVRKHRLIERLLTDFMGYTAGEAHEKADELGDTFDDDMIDRIDEKLGHPSAARTAGPSIPRSSRLRTSTSPRSQRSRPERMPRSSGSPSTTESCSTGSTPTGSSPGRSSR